MSFHHVEADRDDRDNTNYWRIARIATEEPATCGHRRYGNLSDFGGIEPVAVIVHNDTVGGCVVDLDRVGCVRFHSRRRAQNHLLRFERFTTATEDPSVTPDGTETEFYNDTTQIDANATDLEVTVNGTNGSDVFVNYYRIANDSSSTETLESEDMILNSATGNETTASWPVQTNETSSYRVVVHDNGNGLSTDDVGNITVTPLAGSSSRLSR